MAKAARMLNTSLLEPAAQATILAVSKPDEPATKKATKSRWTKDQVYCIGNHGEAWWLLDEVLLLDKQKFKSVLNEAVVALNSGSISSPGYAIVCSANNYYFLWPAEKETIEVFEFMSLVKSGAKHREVLARQAGKDSRDMQSRSLSEDPAPNPDRSHQEVIESGSRRNIPGSPLPVLLASPKPASRQTTPQLTLKSTLVAASRPRPSLAPDAFVFARQVDYGQDGHAWHGDARLCRVNSHHLSFGLRTS